MYAVGVGGSTVNGPGPFPISRFHGVFVWTGKRLRAISRELAQLGLRVCPNTVRRLLAELDYALHANRKSLCSSHPQRDEQFAVQGGDRLDDALIHDAHQRWEIREAIAFLIRAPHAPTR